MRSPGAALAVLLAATSAGLSATQGEQAQQAVPARPHLLLVTVDSLRRDRLGCYRGGADGTPAIDGLTALGVRFERAYATSPSTAPSSASILTGLYPSRHGLRNDLGGRIRGDVRTVAQRLHDAGYSTAAVVGSFHLDSARGFDRGFDRYDDNIKPQKRRGFIQSKERRADEVVDLGLRFIDEAPKDRPFFLWLDFYDPHFDYDPPAALRQEYESAPYDGEVAFVDLQMAALLKGLRDREIQERTAVLFAGSHGEGLGEHGEVGHGIYLYETTIRVPLLIASVGPRSARGVSVDAAVSLADLAPTLLDLAGLPVPADLDGRSLLSWLQSTTGVAPSRRKRPAGDERRLFIEALQPREAYGWSPLYAVVQGGRKVVGGRRLESFDLALDPDEVKPFAPPPRWGRKLGSFGAALLGELDPPEGQRTKTLRDAVALGMPWDNSPICLDRQDWPDPRDPDRVALNERLFKARMYQDHMLPGGAAQLAREVLEVDPANYTALELVVALALRNGWLSMILDPLELLQCQYPFRGAGYHYLGHYYIMTKNHERAVAAFEMLSRVEPEDDEADYDLAAVYAGTGDRDRAFSHFRRALALGADDYEFIRQDPRLRALRDDPRFEELLVAAGAPPPPPPR